MEWSKIKTILIFIFVLVNLFLFVMFFKGEYVDNTLSDEIIDNTVIILQQNNITADKSVMPKIHNNVKICIVENKYSTVLDMLNAARQISTQNGVDYLKEDNTVISGESFTCTVNSKEDISNTFKYTKKEIVKTGLLEDIEYKAVEKNGYVYFYLKFQNKIFYDSYIRVRTTNQGIQEIYGYNWLGDVVAEGGISETVSPAEIIIDFALDAKFKKNVKLESVLPGYYIGERGETVRVTASPVWEISTSDGQVFYYDMRNGDFLK